MRYPATWRMAFFVMALALAAAGCTDESGEATRDQNPPPSTTAAANPPDFDPTASATSEGRLAFRELYDIPVAEHDPADGLPALLETGDLIDAGVEAGVWTEAEGVRAVISVIIGELSIEALPALDRMAKRTHHGVLEKAQALLEGDALTVDERSDLTRLTSFFFADPLDDAAGGPALARLVSFQAQQNTCTLDEVKLFQAPDSPGTCYNVTENEHGDIVYGPSGDNPGEMDPTEQVLDLLELARSRYPQLSGSDLPPVEVLISTRTLPPDPQNPNFVTNAHTLASERPCRIAVFATQFTQIGGLTFDRILAHELFHCIQGTWLGEFTAGADGLAEEGGAEYFSYRLIGQCEPILEMRGPTLDEHTTHGSLLETDYAGWFFWAYLDEHKGIDSTVISQLHQVVKAGTQVDQALEQFVPDLPKAINEFYVRLIGPGLACDYQGEKTTGEQTVEEEGPIDLDAQLFVGTRYELTYEKELLFAQSDPGGGWIGMAKKADRGAKDAWVVVAKEVRTRCEETEEWFVVVTALDQSGEARKIEVDRTAEAVCDSCLLGTWDVDVSTLDEFYEVSAGIDIEVGGSWTIEFQAGADDSATAPMNDQREITLQFGGASTPQRDADASGTYSADDTTLTVTGHTEDVTVTVQGFTGIFSGSDGPLSLPYTCEGDELSVSRGTATFQATRSPATPEGDPYFE